jgi:DNA-directed RNA polymerase specialized sigma24 family protein
MTEPDQFDQFYKDVRTRLLLLTYLLTGDLPSSRAAVRDAFVVAWHHWRKVSRVEDPEAWVREHACRHAQRRHTAKLWHREKGLDPEVKATLDALAKLTMTQRRVLLVTELTTASLAGMAREAGLPRTEAERELQVATSTFALHRGVPTTAVRGVLEGVREHVATVQWPRPTILRRAGATRRRTHTVIGVAATAAALVVTGTLVTDADGVRPTLAGERVGGDNQPAAAPEQVDLPDDAMVTASQVDAAAPGHAWSATATDDNSSDDYVSAPCQKSRYASPRPIDALVRTFEAGSGKAQQRTTALQSTEASATDKAARRGYQAAVGWFAGCTDARAQLVTTRSVQGVGDEATLVVLRAWDDGPDSTIVAGVARTGRFTTVAVTQAADAKPAPRKYADLLGEAVGGLCDLDGVGTCSTSPTPSTRSEAPVPVSPAPGMLSVVDLPPVTGVTEPWVAVPPKQARTNVAATRCDNTSFTAKYAGSTVSQAATGSFLILESKLPAEFGLTETVGALPAKSARTFVDGVRAKLVRCGDKTFGTEVRRTLHVDKRHQDLTVWHVTTAVTDDRSMTTLMAILRNGTSVAQLAFVPAKGATMQPGHFEDLARRALQRLAEIPAPTS